MKKLASALAFVAALVPFSAAHANNTASIFLDWNHLITSGDAISFSSYGGGNGGVTGTLGGTTYYSNTTNSFGSVNLGVLSSGGSVTVNTPATGASQSDAGLSAQIYRTFSLQDSQSVLIKVPYTLTLNVADAGLGSNATANFGLNVWGGTNLSFNAGVSKSFAQNIVGSLSKSGFLNIYIGNDSGATEQYVINGYASAVATSVAAVPEPETYAMLLAGLGLMGVIAKRRKSKAV